VTASASPSNPRQQAMSTGLSLRDAPNTPLELFQAWFEQTKPAGVPQPRAMTLATVNALGRPAARMVLLAGFDPRGFDFATDARSPKIEDAQRQPWVALVFYWAELERQVRVEGQLEPLDSATSDRYFYQRSRASQLSTWLAPQSTAVAGRASLEEDLLQRAAAFDGQTVPRPPDYRAYRVRPALVEFWQARTDRINDRLRYTLAADGSWAIQRLAP